jgi:outer membrane protein OmpA-like peptidoglycan-associated protein
MRGHPGNSAFEELRHIILSAEREQLRDLRDRVSDRERRSRDVANILPEAVKLSRERGDELTQALRPAVEGSIKESIEKKPDTFVDALHPIIGPMVQRSIAEIRPDLEACLRSQYTAAKKGGGKKVRAGIAITTVAAFLTALLIVAVRGEWRWRKFVRQLNAQPGLAVTAAHKGWFEPSEIAGLRDASASDPTELARRFSIDPERVQFHWKPFFGLDPASIVQRFKKRFSLPSTTQVSSKNGVLILTGSAPYDWLERVRAEAKFIPGISTLDDSAVDVTYDAASVLQRFSQKFDPPDTVNTALVENTLVLSGEAPQQWLARVSTGASVVPGIKSVDTSKVINLDERTFQRSKSVIENAFVYFLTNKDDIASEGFAILSRLPDEIRRCETAARRIGMNITLEILGYADAVGDEAKNVDLSQRRAHKVADFLSLCGFEFTDLQPIGMGEAAKPPAMEKATPDLAQRRVSFRVIAEPASIAR